jgi:molybdopterin/thiamine biosynthesis adenylyltransferase
METSSEVTEIVIKEPQFLRHADYVGPENFIDTVNIIGLGAVGSHLAMLAARMGVHKFRIFDGDKVEPHNLSNQAYDSEHIGMYKAEALKEVLTRFNPRVQVEVHNYFYESEKHKDLIKGFLLIAPDSMKVRRDLYDTFKDNFEIAGVIEIRLGFDYGECNVLNPISDLETERWLQTLVDDSLVPDGPCNRRMCTTLVQLVCSVAIQNLCNYYAALRRRELWRYSQKTMFSLTDQVRTMSI